MKCRRLHVLVFDSCNGFSFVPSNQFHSSSVRVNSTFHAESNKISNKIGSVVAHSLTLSLSITNRNKWFSLLLFFVLRHFVTDNKSPKKKLHRTKEKSEREGENELGLDWNWNCFKNVRPSDDFNTYNYIERDKSTKKEWKTLFLLLLLLLLHVYILFKCFKETAAIRNEFQFLQRKIKLKQNWKRRMCKCKLAIHCILWFIPVEIEFSWNRDCAFVYYYTRVS